MAAKKKIPEVVDDVGMTTPVLASEIQRISASMKRLRAGKLNDDALILLIQHAAGYVRAHGTKGYRTPKPVPVTMIRAVLTGMENLEAAWLKPKNK